MRVTPIILLILLLCTVSCRVNEDLPPNTKDLMAYYEANASDEISSPLNGAFLVTKEDQVLFKGGFGKVNLHSEELIGPDTKFYIGSISKPFTACLILQLVQEGLLNLERPISAYLPDFPKDKGDRINIHQLLSHTSGLPHYPELLKHGYTRTSFFSKAISVKEYVALIGKLQLQEAGNYSYSSFGYVLLGAIIENITQQSFGVVLEEKICRPLGLINTGYSANKISEGLAEDQYFTKGRLFRTSNYRPIPDREMSTAYATGGIYSSLNDLQRWAKALKENTLLRPEYQVKMFSPVARGVCYGLFHNPEPFLRNDQDAQLFYHGGEIMGYKSVLAMYDDGITIICLFNTTPLQNGTHFINQLHLSALGKNQRVKHWIHPSLSKLKNFEKEGGLPAFDHYHEQLSKRAGYPILPSPSTLSRVAEMHLKEGKPQVILDYVEKLLSRKIDYPEPVLNELGYAFLNEKHYEMAIKILTVNAERYPHSANVYDSLGEAYRKSGDELKAQYFYDKVKTAALK